MPCTNSAFTKGVKIYKVNSNMTTGTKILVTDAKEQEKSAKNKINLTHALLELTKTQDIPGVNTT